MTHNEIQNRVFDLVTKGDFSVAEHISIGRELTKDSGPWPEYFRFTRVAFLSNFTLQGLPEVFRVRALAHNIWADTYLGPYNQYAQEILNPENGLYNFQPKLVYFVIDSMGADEDQINKLAGVLRGKNIAVKIIWGSAIKKKFPEYWYTKYKEMGDLRLAPRAFPSFVDKELMEEAVAVSGATKKCLVVDLDNTLWKGIVGESDYKEIGPDNDLQRHVLNLHKQGVVLAVNSRNNYHDAVLIMDGHPDMILSRDHFAALKINWQDKADNMAELAKELNLGLDSFVFVDDDPFQRINVKNRFPEVAVLSPDKLASYPGFSFSVLTAEDKRRGQMYVEENKRREFQSSLVNISDFLKELNLEIEIASVGSDNLARVAQLTQKTNQFNLTTRRYSEDEIENFIASGWKVWAVKAKDKFGDYGIIGAGMVEPRGHVWRVDNFLLSCRILGREIEKVFLGQIMIQAKSAGVIKISAEFMPTAKNQPCQGFYPSNGFNLIRESDKALFYERSLDLDYKIPDFIKVNYENC